VDTLENVNPPVAQGLGIWGIAYIAGNRAQKSCSLLAVM
jgi:hypothetical protein